MSDARTVAVYAARALEYDAMAQDTITDRRAFVAALPAGDGPILDWGCGPGHDAAAFAAAGLWVEATDATPAMVDLAAKKGVTARCESFEALPETSRMRGIWANFSLLHAEAAALPGLIARAAFALVPGGVLHLGMKRGTGTARDDLDRRYAYVEAKDLDRITVRAGLSRVGLRHGRGAGLSGRDDDYIIHLSRKSHD
ncbi:class I SAM-dependent methyltransferase [Jannaschia donghaensis]|uniref:Trans-aconitate methyltransferase n=1 Tax=Jannaschia donghaensis TaxID=420998 RepID=A0A0M6YJE8_9RHOB|nr:class I SAM-dependent methyltransferase [Jannaschia donghaensis]CTQ50044.1 Trans-aconitate methyltransferase [Jannaschia donghaensis]